jgi:CHC2-type zinc finger protein
MDDFHGVFRRHLDLSPLRGRTRGLVRCIFHEDRDASLSLDLERGLFHCFGCGAKGGYRAFAGLVGEAPLIGLEPIEESPFAMALRIGESQRWAAEDARLMAAINDWIRQTRQVIAEVRKRAKDTEPWWDILEQCARLERTANVTEWRYDELMAGAL